ncbi:MAG: META domain-containing protein [Chloroflexota bacterium]
MDKETTTFPLEGTRWILTSYLEADGTTATALSNIEATATFEGGTVSGKSSCNRYSAGYTVKGDMLIVSEGMRSTLMACSPAILHQEQQFQTNLRSAATYEINGNVLTISDTTDRVVLTMEADTPIPLATTTWVARNYNNGKQAVVSVLTDTKITALFNEDGRLGGSAGCNNYTAGYEIEDDKITIAAPAATRKMCIQPEGIMEQESLYLQALVTAATFRIDGQILELRTDTGALVASFQAERSESD